MKTKSLPLAILLLIITSLFAKDEPQKQGAERNDKQIDEGFNRRQKQYTPEEIAIIEKATDKGNDEDSKKKALMTLKYLAGNGRYDTEKLKRIAVKVSKDEDQDVRYIAGEIFVENPSIQDVNAVLEMLQNEFTLPIGRRGLSMKKRNIGWNNDAIIMICIDVLTRIDRKDYGDLAPILALKSLENKELKFCLSHVRYRIGELPIPIDDMIEGVKISTSNRIVSYLIYDLAEIGDKRALHAIESQLGNSFSITDEEGTIYPIRLAAQKAIKKINK